MAEKIRYPQIPSTVWWGLRSILQRTPNATVDERFLSVQLSVQEAAARAYVAELKGVGLLTEEGKATPLAQKWRLDDTYEEAADELLASSYPEGLLHVAPPGEADRQKVVSWFLREGFGQGAAGNKAATYLLIGSRVPNEAPSRSTGRVGKDEGAKRATTPKRPTTRTASSATSASGGSSKENEGKGGRASPVPMEGIPLNINVQIHISADAGSEQIESIFSAMRRYLYDDPRS